MTQQLITCVHHYLVEPPEGAHSQGMCKKCGKVRQFTNVPTGGLGPVAVQQRHREALKNETK